MCGQPLEPRTLEALDLKLLLKLLLNLMNFSSRAKPEGLSYQNFYTSNKLYFFCRFFHTKHTCPGWDSLPELWAPYAPRVGSVRGRYGSPCEPGKRAFNTRKVFQSMASFTETRVEPSRLAFWFRQKFVGSLCLKKSRPEKLVKTTIWRSMYLFQRARVPWCNWIIWTII